MCNCHSILECCVMFSGVKLSIRSFNLFLAQHKEAPFEVECLLKLSFGTFATRSFVV